MGPELKRENVVVVDRFLVANDLFNYLKHYEVDVKMVTKHAIQVHPRHAERAKELLKDFKHGKIND